MQPMQLTSPSDPQTTAPLEPPVPFDSSPYREWVAPAVAPPKPTPAPRIPRPRELLALGIAVVVADVALWGGTGGFGLALLLTVVPLALALAVPRVRRSPRLMVIGVLLLSVIGRSIIAPTVASTTLGALLVLAWAVHLRQRTAYVPELLRVALAMPLLLPGRIAAFGMGLRRLAPTRLGRRAIPVVVPLALGAVFIGVFALANPVVAGGLKRGWTAVTSYAGVPSGWRFLTWGLLGVALAPLFRPAGLLRKQSFAMAEEGSATPLSLSVGRNALALLNAIFLAFNGLDAAYLWAGSPPPGVDTQSYARSGAFWLTVGLALTTATLGVLFRRELAFDPRARVARILAYTWVGQSFVLAAGAFRRMTIHVQWSGLSELRILGFFGTALVCVGLGFVVVKLARRRTFSWVLRRQLDAFVVTVAIFALTPAHLLSAKVNTRRILAGEYRPLIHVVKEQAYEAESAAALLPLLHHHDPIIRRSVAALLLEERSALQSARATPWTHHDVATRSALQALDRHEAELVGVAAAVTPGEARDHLLRIFHEVNTGKRAH